MLPPKEKIEEIIRELQKIMRVQDWDIELKILTSGQMQKETGDIDNIGEADRNIHTKSAVIRLNTEDEGGCFQGWYHTLIHEMKHIQTTEFIYLLGNLLDGAEMPENIKKVIKWQTNDYYEQWMNNCAREFVTAYPLSNFFPEEIKVGGTE